MLQDFILTLWQPGGLEARYLWKKYRIVHLLSSNSAEQSIGKKHQVANADSTHCKYCSMYNVQVQYGSQFQLYSKLHMRSSRHTLATVQQCICLKIIYLVAVSCLLTYYPQNMFSLCRTHAINDKIYVLLLGLKWLVFDALLAAQKSNAIPLGLCMWECFMCSKWNQIYNLLALTWLQIYLLHGSRHH